MCYAVAEGHQQKLDLLCERKRMMGLEVQRLSVGLGWLANEFDWKLLRESWLFVCSACSVSVVSIPQMAVEVQDRNLDSMLSMASFWKEHRVHHSSYQTYNNWHVEVVRHSTTSPSVLRISRSLHGHHWQHLVTKVQKLSGNDETWGTNMSAEVEWARAPNCFE